MFVFDLNINNMSSKFSSDKFPFIYIDEIIISSIFNNYLHLKNVTQHFQLLFYKASTLQKMFELC